MCSWFNFLNLSNDLLNRHYSAYYKNQMEDQEIVDILVNELNINKLALKLSLEQTAILILLTSFLCVKKDVKYFNVSLFCNLMKKKISEKSKNSFLNEKFNKELNIKKENIHVWEQFSNLSKDLIDICMSIYYKYQIEDEDFVMILVNEMNINQSSFDLDFEQIASLVLLTSFLCVKKNIKYVDVDLFVDSIRKRVLRKSKNDNLIEILNGGVYGIKKYNI